MSPNWLVSRSFGLLWFPSAQKKKRSPRRPTQKNHAGLQLGRGVLLFLFDPSRFQEDPKKNQTRRPPRLLRLEGAEGAQGAQGEEDPHGQGASFASFAHFEPRTSAGWIEGGGVDLMFFPPTWRRIWASSILAGSLFGEGFDLGGVRELDWRFQFGLSHC